MASNNCEKREIPARNGYFGSLALVAVLVIVVGNTQGAVVQLSPQAQNGGAIGVNGTATFDPVNLYAANGGYGMAFLLPLVDLPRGGVDGGIINFQTKLNGGQNGVANAPGKYTGNPAWTYAAAAADLPANSITITAYDVHGGADYVGIDGNLGANPRTAGFAAKLTNAPANSHWIQVITDNNAIFNDATHPGTKENIIDIGTNTTTPYYDDGGAANSTNFFDAPRRPDVTTSNYWLADLYVAAGPDATKNPGQVTLYNGVAYGWANIFVSAATIQQFKNVMNNQILDNLGDLDTAVGAPTGGLDGYYETGASNPADDPSGLQLLDSEFNADLSELPEPSSFLTILFAGVSVLLRHRIKTST